MRRWPTLLLLLLGPTLGMAQEIAVLVSAKSPVTELSREQAQKIFLGQPVLPNGVQRLVPLDQRDGPVRDAFYSRLLGRSPSQMRAYWSRIVFTGRGEPPIEIEQSRLPGTIAADASLVSYALRSEVTSGVRIVLTLP